MRRDKEIARIEREHQRSRTVGIHSPSIFRKMYKFLGCIEYKLALINGYIKTNIGLSYVYAYKTKYKYFWKYVKFVGRY